MARRDSGASSDDGPLTARITNEAFLCPIGCSTMRDPVFLADGHSYERANIDAWIERRHAAGLAVTSPATGAVMPEPLSTSHSPHSSKYVARNHADPSSDPSEKHLQSNAVKEDATI